MEERPDDHDDEMLLGMDNGPTIMLGFALIMLLVVIVIAGPILIWWLL